MSIDSSNSIQKKAQQIIKTSAVEKRITILTLTLIRNLQISDLAYIIIMFIDFLQVLSIITAGKIYSKWDGFVFEYVEKGLSFISIEFIMKQHPESHMGLLIIAISLLIVTYIAGCIIIKLGSNLQNNSQILKIAVNIIGFLLILLKSLLQIPFFFMILFAFFHNYVQKPLMIGLSASFLILLLPITLYDIFIFTDLNPFSSLVFAGENHLQRLVNILIKLGLTLYSTLDQERKYQLAMLLTLLCLKLVIIIFTHYNSSQQEYNSRIQHYKLWQRYVLVWFIVFLLIGDESSRNQKLYIFFAMISISFFAMINCIQSSSRKRVLYENFINLDSVKLIQRHVLNLIKIIDSVHQRQSRILFEGYIAFHVRNCNLPCSTCICKEILNHSNLQLENLKHLYFEFLASLLKGSLNRVNEPRRIYILLSNIYQYRLNNRFQAVHCLIKSQYYNESIMQRLQFLSQIKLIEAQISQAQSKKNSNLTVDMMRFLKFNIKIVQFEQLLDDFTNNQIDFWNQIMEINLNITKLQNCGSIIAEQKQVVKEFFHQMQELNSNNAHVMIVYAQFLSWVCNQDFQNSKLLQKGQSILKNIQQSTKANEKNEKYSDNSNTVIILISGNDKQVGKITQTNNYVKQLIGYERKELISQNITIIMPKLYAEFHTTSVQRFLQTSKDKYNGNGIQRLVPILCKNGYIKPCLIFTKPIPNLKQGIQLVGFVSQYDHVLDDQFSSGKTGYLLYERESELIMGINQVCQAQFGIPKCLVHGSPNNTSNQLKLRHIFGFNIQKIQGGLQTGKEVLTTINTSNLKNQFIFNAAIETSKSLEQPATIQVSNLSVILRMTVELSYYGHQLKILSIIKQSVQNQSQYSQRRQLKKLSHNQNRQQKSDSKSETDQIKDLKDFKNFISVKKQPRAISFIGWACIVFILINICGALGFIIINIKEVQLMSTTMKALKLSFLNRMYLSQISFQIQKYYINHNDFFSKPIIFPQNVIKNKINDLIQKAKNTELNLMPLKNVLQAKQLFIKDFIFYPNCTYGTEDLLIDESINIQLNKFFHIGNAKGVYLKPYPLQCHSLTIVNYLQTKYNQVFQLTNACNQVQKDITSQGVKKNSGYTTLVIIQSCILVVIGFIWFAISLPKNLQVAQINSKVLSLFTLISPQQVQGIIKKCFIFQTKFLSQTNTNRKKFEQTTKSMERQALGKLEKKKSSMELEILQSKYNTNQNSLDTSARAIINHNNFPKNKDSLNIDNFQDNEQDSKIVDKGNSDNRKAIITFLIILVFMLSYCVAISLYLGITYTLIEDETRMLNLIYNRTAQFQQIKSSYIKLLMDRSLNYSNKTIGQINIDLISRIYDTQRLLIEDTSSRFAQLINYMNTINICNFISQYQSFYLWGSQNDVNSSQCSTISNQILTRGIKTTLVTVMEEIRGMISLSTAQRQKLNMYDIIVQTIKKYSILQKYLVRPLIMMGEQIMQSKLQTQNKYDLIFYLANSLFILGILLFWKFAWRRYLVYLNQSVWRTKSMLNVIPSKIITNNQTLMKQFTSGQLQKVVK